MSYHCVNSDCANHSASFPKEAASNLEFKCFLCSSPLEEPPIEIEKLINSIETLPASLQIMPKLQMLLSDLNSSISDIIGLIKTDASLVTHIVKVSNSAFYAASTHCSTIEESMNRIGFTEAYNIIGYVAASHILQGDLEIYDQQAADLWEHSVRSATSMQILGRQIKAVQSYTLPASGIAYTVGLLHPIGKILVNHYHSNYPISALKGLKEKLTPSLEKKLWGFDNREAGSRLLEKWHFDKNISLPILYQDDPMETPGDRPLACLLALVRDAVCNLPKSTLRRDPQSLRDEFQPNPIYMEVVGINKKDFLEGIGESVRDFQKLSNSLTV